jgi:hypothetical protein
MSTFGDADRVRHLYAAGETWAVWTFEAEGNSRVMAYRRRTRSVSVQGNIPVDGEESSERVIGIGKRPIANFQVSEIEPGDVLVVYQDTVGVIWAFMFRVDTGDILSQPQVVTSDSRLPAVITSSGSTVIFYLKNRSVYLRYEGGQEGKIIDLSANESIDFDVDQRPGEVETRYAGMHIASRSLALPMKADAGTVLLYNGQRQAVTVTEGLPPGTVSYWTFDPGDFSGTTLLDVVGGNNASLSGAAPAAVSGQVGGAREFVVGGGHYSAGNPVSLRISGDKSLAFWIRPSAFPDSINSVPGVYGKSWGGEGWLALEPDQTLTYYFGTAGANASPYNTFKSGFSLSPGRWSHVVLTRDFSTRSLRWYLDGFLAKQEGIQAASASVSSLSALIGRSWVPTTISAALDDMIVANQAWSAETVEGLWQKGRGGLLASTSGQGQGSRLVDGGAGANNASMSIVNPVKNICQHQAGPSSVPLASLNLPFTVPSSVTFEWRIRLSGLDNPPRNLFNSYAGPNISGTRQPGTVVVSLLPNMALEFRFETASTTVIWRQTGGRLADRGEVNHLAVVHTFGLASSTAAFVNGVAAIGSWISGTGNEAPSMAAVSASINLARGDELIDMKISNVAKTASDIRTYLRGRL